MYEAFYGLSSRPFDLSPDPRYLVQTEIHHEALSNLEHAITSRKGISLLVGEAGTGKTTVIRAAIEKPRKKVHCVYLHNPALTRVEFVRMLARQFELSADAHNSKTDLLFELERLLSERQRQNETTVIVIDEAQCLPSELLDEVRLLTNIETSSDKLLLLIIAGQPEIAEKLNEPAFRQLKQRIALRCELRPLHLEESAKYIAGRIQSAGGRPSYVFTREAVGVVHEHARGIPRVINVSADNALLTGFAEQERPVRTDIVRRVCRDFDIAAGAPAQNARQSTDRRPSEMSLTSSEREMINAGMSAYTDVAQRRSLQTSSATAEDRRFGIREIAQSRTTKKDIQRI